MVRKEPGTVVQQPSEAGLPKAIGRYLIDTLNLDPDWVWRLRALELVYPGNECLRDVRIFNPAATRHLATPIEEYHHLDDYQELVLFEGWYDETNNNCHITIRPF